MVEKCLGMYWRHSGWTEVLDELESGGARVGLRERRLERA